MNLNYRQESEKKRINTITTMSDLCVACNKESHPLTKCPDFKKMSVDDRWIKVRESGACFSCLKLRHRTQDYTVRKPCHINNCRSFHNRFLHKELLPTTQTVNNINIESLDLQ